jgi:hypothetical protein
MAEVLANLLLAVEQQLHSPQTPYVKACFERLQALGMDESQIREEIADCLGHELDEMLEKKRAFSEVQYRALLDALPWQEKPVSNNDLSLLDG